MSMTLTLFAGSDYVKIGYSDVTHGIATTKRNMTLTSFDVVSTFLFYF